MATARSASASFSLAFLGATTRATLKKQHTFYVHVHIPGLAYII